MKRLSYIIYAIMFFSILPACSKGETERKNGNGPHAPTYQEIAKEMSLRHAPFDSILPIQQKAVEELRAGRSKDNPVDVLQQMGYLYCRHGQADLGTEYLLEAVDSLERKPSLNKEDREAAAYLYGNLANQYVRMRMYKEALAANRKGLDHSKGLDEMFECNLWRMRANMFEFPEVPDSILKYYDIALEKASGDDRLSRSVRAQRAEYIILHHENFTTEEVRKELNYLESIDTSDLPIKNSARLTIGEGRIMFGDTASGLKMMEEGLKTIRQMDDVEMLQYGEKHLLLAYAKAGEAEKLADLFPEYDAICDTLLNREKINSVMTSEFRFRTKKKDLETQMWKERNADARKIIVLQWVAIILGILTASFFIFTILAKLRNARKSKAMMRSRLQSILAQQKEVNSTIETLNSRIEQMNSELENRSDTEEIHKLIAEMPPSLLSETQEALFRRYFAQIYPHFIPDLRRDYPSITPNDELISMLIYMKYSSEEIALFLGISKQSVNSARYRLRKKLDLDKETDLNVFLTSRKG